MIHLIQINLPQFNNKLKDLISNINSEDIIRIEKEPHVTVLYGFTKEEEYFNIRRDIETLPIFNIRIGNISVFDNEDWDVLKFDIISEDLIDIHEFLKENYTNNVTRPYSAHMTIAYLEKGTSNKYLNLEQSITGTKVEVKNMFYCHNEKYKLEIPLGIKEQEEIINND